VSKSAKGATPVKCPGGIEDGAENVNGEKGDVVGVAGDR
jgi:hypothetical protein